jgi:hypothetical protein
VTCDRASTPVAGARPAEGVDRKRRSALAVHSWWEQACSSLRLGGLRLDVEASRSVQRLRVLGLLHQGTARPVPKGVLRGGRGSEDLVAYAAEPAYGSHIPTVSLTSRGMGFAPAQSRLAWGGRNEEN